MNKIQIVLVALMIGAFTNLSQAQSLYPVIENYSAAETERMDKNFTDALNSGNNGVVASALAVVTMIKLDHPADEFPMVSEQINYLATHSATPLIRYRACLAGAVFANPANFKNVTVNQYGDPGELFSALDNSPDKPLLSTK